MIKIILIILRVILLKNFHLFPIESRGLLTLISSVNESRKKTSCEFFSASKHKNSVSIDEKEENTLNQGSSGKDKKPRKLTKDLAEFSGLM